MKLKKSLAIVLASILLLMPIVKVQAKADYRFLQTYELSKKAVKVGNYYFKSNDTSCSYSRYKSRGYQVISGVNPITSGYIITNGSFVFFINENGQYYYLNKFDTVKKQNKRVAKLSTAKNVRSEPYSWYFSYYYDQKIYLTRGSFDQWSYGTFVYNIKTNKLSKKLMNGAIGNGSKNYVAAQMAYRTDVNSYPVNLYKISTNGQLKKVKTLTQYGRIGKFVGPYLYYTHNPIKNNLGKMQIYRVNRDGTQRQLIKTITDQSDTKWCTAYNFTKNGCNIDIGSHDRYKLNFKTKKLTKI